MRLEVLLEGSKIWEGDFTLSGKHITVHAPEIVTGNCYFNAAGLRSLKGSPTEVRKSFYCPNNKLRTLRYAPAHVGADFICRGNDLKNLIGAPIKVLKFDCSDNPSLTSLAGAPREMDALFINGTAIHDFDGINNHIKSIKGIDIGGIKLTGPVLSVLLIPTLTSIDVSSSADETTQAVVKVLNKWIKEQSMKPMERASRCQDELVELGFEEQAEL